MINLKDLNPNKTNIDKKSFRNILIYHTEDATVKDCCYAKINSVNFLRFIISKINGYIEERNRNKCLMLFSMMKAKTR